MLAPFYGVLPFYFNKVIISNYLLKVFSLGDDLHRRCKAEPLYKVLGLGDDLFSRPVAQ